MSLLPLLAKGCALLLVLAALICCSGAGAYYIACTHHGVPVSHKEAGQVACVCLGLREEKR
jgi:hypothetical protein